VSPTARRFFGCVLPLALLFGACGVVVMLGYSSRVVLDLAEVADTSMAPVLRPGMTVLTNNTAFWYEDPYRPAVVTVASPEGRHYRQVVGLPGETIEVEGREVRADGRLVLRLSPEEPFPRFGPVKLGPSQYFVLAGSAQFPDSRTWGPLEKDRIFGTATFWRSARSPGWQPVITPPPTPSGP
jgi:signal peptidase I